MESPIGSALKGLCIDIGAASRASMRHAFSVQVAGVRVPQGASLGWYVQPLQGRGSDTASCRTGTSQHLQSIGRVDGPGSIVIVVSTSADPCDPHNARAR